MFYLASPMTNPIMKDKEQDSEFYSKRNEKLVNKLEKAGIRLYFPQRGTDQELAPKKILAKNMGALKNSDAVIVILSDSRGVYLEAGFAKGLGKKVIGLKVEETRNLGLISRNFFDYAVESIDELIILLRDMGNQE